MSLQGHIVTPASACVHTRNSPRASHANNMAGEAYPGAIAGLDGDSEAVHRQLVSVARFHQQRTCEFAAVGFPRLWRLVLPVRRQSARTR